MCPWGFPSGSVNKESACNAGDLGSILGLGRSPGVGTGNPLQYSCLENPMDRGAWQAIVHEVSRLGHYLATKPCGRCHRENKDPVSGDSGLQLQQLIRNIHK